MNPETIYTGWMWEMFRDYVRKITRTASMGAMLEEQMQERYRSLYRDFEIKIMVSEKVGMVIQFLDLDTYRFQDFEGLLEESAFLGFLGEKYGRGKFKVNLYHNATFIATKNFTIEEGPEKWRDRLASP